MSDERIEGTVKWWSPAKGYGFIGVTGQPDIFVHFSGIRRIEEQKGHLNLTPNAKVSFTIVPSPNGGTQAGDVVEE